MKEVSGQKLGNQAEIITPTQYSNKEISMANLRDNADVLPQAGDRGQFPEVRFHLSGYADSAAAFKLHIQYADGAAEL